MNLSTHYYDRIEGSVLYAHIKNKPTDQWWHESRIDLDDYIGSTNGWFDLSKSGWYKSCVSGEPELHAGTSDNTLDKANPRKNLLRVYLLKSEDEGGSSSQLAVINLDLFISVRNGELFGTKL
jgi:hypothetical protein